MKIELSFFKLILLLTIVLGAYGCKDFNGEQLDAPEMKCSDECVTFKGQITSGNGTAPLINTRVQLIYKDQSVIVDEIAITRTNGEGKYELKVPYPLIAQNDGKVILRILTNDETYPLYGARSHSKYLEILEPNMNYTWDFFIPQKTEVDVRFELTEPMKEGDKISVRGTFPFGEAGDSNFGYSYHDGPTDTDWSAILESMIIAANVDVVLEKTIIKDGQTTTEEAVINLTVGEQKTITVVFE